MNIDIAGLRLERVAVVPSPLAELGMALHALSEPGHHPGLQGWVTGVTGGIATVRPSALTDTGSGCFARYASAAAPSSVCDLPFPLIVTRVRRVPAVSVRGGVGVVAGTACNAATGSSAANSPRSPGRDCRARTRRTTREPHC